MWPTDRLSAPNHPNPDEEYEGLNHEKVQVVSSGYCVSPGLDGIFQLRVKVRRIFRNPYRRY